MLLQVVALLLFGGSPFSASMLETKDAVLASEIALVSESWASTTGTAVPAQLQSASEARVAAVIFCQSLADMAQPLSNRRIAGDASEAQSGRPAAPRRAAMQAGALLLSRIMDASLADKDVQGTVPFKGSAVHRKKTRVWQALVVLTQFHEAAGGALTVEDVLSTLQQGEVASIKQYQEAGASHGLPVSASTLRGTVERLVDFRVAGGRTSDLLHVHMH